MRRDAVITGDIVESRKVQSYSDLIGTLKDALDMVGRKYQYRYEIYRGDSFQVSVPEVSDAVRAAILIRAQLRAQSPAGREKWDARVAIGIGRQESNAAPINESVGEAYVLSGLGLDLITKTDRCLIVQTPSRKTNEAIDLLTMFADDVISNWSQLSAEIAYYRLSLKESQSELGKILGKSQPTIHARIKRARLNLIEAYIERVNAVFEQESMT